MQAFTAGGRSVRRPRVGSRGLEGKITRSSSLSSCAVAPAVTRLPPRCCYEGGSSCRYSRQKTLLCLETPLLV